MIEPTILRTAITLDHISLQCELLVIEMAELRKHPEQFQQADVDQLHKLVANCLLFIDSGPQGARLHFPLQPEEPAQ